MLLIPDAGPDERGDHRLGTHPQQGQLLTLGRGIGLFVWVRLHVDGAGIVKR